MHEAKVAKYTYEIIRDTIQADSDLKGKKVEQIVFTQSFPNTVVPHSFEFYFEELVKETLLEGAELIFKDGEQKGFFVSSLIVED